MAIQQWQKKIPLSEEQVRAIGNAFPYFNEAEKALIVSDKSHPAYIVHKKEMDAKKKERVKSQKDKEAKKADREANRLKKVMLKEQTKALKKEAEKQKQLEKDRKLRIKAERDALNKQLKAMK